MLPSIIVDVLLVAIVLFGMVSGAYKGFVKTVAKPVKFVASLLFAYYVCDSISVKFIEPFINTPIANQLKDFMYEKCANLTAENVSTELPTLLKMAAGMFGINVEEVAQGSVNGVLDAIIESLTGPIVHVIGIIVSFILAYIAAKIILSIAVFLIDIVLKGGALGVVNKILGFVFGSAFSVIVAWALVSVAEFAMGFVGYNFESGFIYNFFSNFNPLDLLLSF